jgi:hypothetical protein
MSAGRYNLFIDQGSDFAIEFTIKDNGSAKDLTNYSARAQMRPTRASSTLSATFTCTIPTPTNGVVKMELSNATSSALSAGRYFYDLEIFTANDALVTRVMQGEVDLTQEVTR